MSTHPIQPSQGKSLELPVEELLRRARPLPSHEDMAIDDLTAEEAKPSSLRSTRERPAAPWPGGYRP